MLFESIIILPARGDVDNFLEYLKVSITIYTI